MQRSYDRESHQMRPVSVEREYLIHADGSCLISIGNTRVLCTATLTPGVPAWRSGYGQGWVTAEYAMLPASTQKRVAREQGKRKGRSMEIERLIGRSLRACVDMKRLGENTVTIDCDVLQADGSTRCASICGAWIALHDALMRGVEKGMFSRIPLTQQVAALSVGIVQGKALVDLDYAEDSHADVDLNIVAAPHGQIVEIQGTAEKSTFSRTQLNELLDMAEPALDELFSLQQKVTEF